MAQNGKNRETFEARLRPLLAPSDVSCVMHAYEISKNRHRGQERMEQDERGAPIRYFEHAREVALIVLDELTCDDPDVICAALLHDTLEDTRMTAEELEHIFGKQVATIVIRVSKVPKEGFAERLLTYGRFEDLAVKVADGLANLRTISAGELLWRKKQIKEFETMRFHFLERLRLLAPTRYRNRIDALEKEMYNRLSDERQALVRLESEEKKLEITLATEAEKRRTINFE